MKQFFILSLLLFVSFNTSIIAQDVLYSSDKNELHFSQELFLKNNNIIALNNRFIKHWIGINIDDIDSGDIISDQYPFILRGINTDNDSIIISKDITDAPVTIKGITYNGKILNLKSSRHKQLVSAEDIKNIYFPEIKNPCIYMINQYFITSDVESYRFETNFIFKVIAIKSTDFDALKNLPPFDIIRIYTKTRRNKEDHPMEGL